MASHGETYVARGMVREGAEGLARADLWIEAFDLDRLERADRLGEARTDAEGRFSIEFRKAAFAHSLSEALAKAGPNLLLTVRGSDGTLLHMTMPRPSASREEVFDIVLEAGPVTEVHSGLHAAGGSDPLAYWAERLGLPAGTSMHELRREVRHLTDEQIRRLDQNERKALRSFASLSVAFPPAVAWAVARCGVPDLVALREWPAPRLRNALAVAGFSGTDVDAQVHRFERLTMLWPENRPEDVVTGIDVDIQDRSVLSRGDWTELRQRDVCMLEDWRTQRDEVAVSSEGRTALDCYLRLTGIGLPADVVDRFRRAGMTGARYLATVDDARIAGLSESLRMAPRDLESLISKARTRVASIEERIVRIVREDRANEREWVDAEAGVDLAPSSEAFVDYEASERFGYLAYLRHIAGTSGSTRGALWVDDVIAAPTELSVEKVPRVQVWNEALERTLGEVPEEEPGFASRWRLLEAHLQIGRLSPFDLAAGDANLELRLRAALVAPFAPPGRFTAAELRMIEDRARQAALRHVEELVSADPEFAEADDGLVAMEVERRLAHRLEPARLDAELHRYRALRELDGRTDGALGGACLLDFSLPPRESTSRLDEATVGMMVLLEEEGLRHATMSFAEWRRRRAALLWPHAAALVHAEGPTRSEAVSTASFRGDDDLGRAERLISDAEVLRGNTSAGGEALSLLKESARLLDVAASQYGATTAIRLLRGRAGILLLARAEALARSDLPEERMRAGECCRAILSLHQDPDFRDRLSLGDVPALLCRLLGQSTSRARREGDLAGLVRSVTRVVEGVATARLSGAPGSEIAAACRSLASVPGTASRADPLGKLVEELRSLGRTPLRPVEAIGDRYDRLVDLAEILFAGHPATIDVRPAQPKGGSPLELLLAAPLPSRDPVADHQKLAAVLLLEEIRTKLPPGSTTCDEERGHPTSDLAADIVRDATLQLSRCSMFVRRFDQLLSAGAGLHERGISTTVRLATQSGLPLPVEQVPFEARSRQWVEIVAAAPECVASAARILRAGLGLGELETIRKLMHRSAALAASAADRLGHEPVPDTTEALHVERSPQHGSHRLDGPWRLTKVLSLARLIPADLQAFREGSPVLAFRMLSRWFDEEFPKHFDRKIEGIGVSLSVAGNRPSMAGIRVWNSGIAFAVSGPDLHERIVWRRPCLASLSAHPEAADSPRLETPIDRTSFAGVNLDSDWVIEISDDVESVDPAAIVDVQLLVEYRAFGEYGQVWGGASRPRVVTRERVFSMRRDFPAAWRALESGTSGRFVTTEKDFAPRLDDLSILNLSLHPVCSGGAAQGSAYLRLEADGHPQALEGQLALQDGVASTRRQERGGQNPWSGFAGAAPVGEWEVAFGAPEVPNGGSLQDVVLAIAYTGSARLRQD